MKETPSSIRAYLILVGVVGLFLQSMVLVGVGPDGLSRAIAGLGIVVAVGYLYGGINAPKLIANDPKRLTTILLIGGGYHPRPASLLRPLRR